MRYLLLSCLCLALLHEAASRRPRIRARNDVPQPEGECDMVQPFDHDFIYDYNYEAFTEHKDVDNMLGKNVRIKCDVTITVPRRCSGKMRVNGCNVAAGSAEGDAEISYSELPESASFEREMSVSEMAFHFNGGQITKIFVDKQERTNITNFKRGILSALQAYNSDLPSAFEVGEVFEIPQETVYGRGVARQKILAKETGLPSMVEIVRDTAEIELPWERRQWNFIRMRNKAKHPLAVAFQDYMTVISEQAWSRVKQTCIYTLSRGRQVESAKCEEGYPMRPSVPYLTEEAMGGVIETTIRQSINLHASRRMTSEDRSTWDVERFDEDNIMFEEEWEETNEAYAKGFEAGATFIKLIREPLSEKSPALVSKLSRWMAISSRAEIEGVWEKCNTECNAEEKSKGRILWAELLNSCINNDWCQIPRCSSVNSTTCEGALETFVRSAAADDEDAKEACLVALESVDAPSEELVDATLKICRGEERNSGRCVRALGEVTRNFLESCEEGCESKKPVENAKTFIVRQLKKACTSRSEEAEEVMIAATECIGRLGRNGSFAADAVLECGVNPEAPAIVSVKALMAYRNITEETLPNEARTKLIALLKNPECTFEARVICFHVLMKKDIPAEEVEEILKTVLEGEDTALAVHVKEDLRTQLLVRGTEFCGLNPEVAARCVECIVKNRWDIGIPAETLQKRPVEKRYEMTRNIFIPYFNTTTACTVTVKTVHESREAILPIIAKLTVEAETPSLRRDKSPSKGTASVYWMPALRFYPKILFPSAMEGRNVSLVEAALDVAGIRPILERILGRNEFYSEIFDKLMKMPINELHGYTEEYLALRSLREEGWYSHLLNVFEPNSPLSLKVLGIDIGLNSLMSIESIRQMTIGNFWKILDLLEEGFEHEIFAAGQPLIMQHAAPTCIGAPIITSVDVSYIFKNKLNLKADLRKIFFSNSEEAELDLTPEIFMSASVSRTILTQFCESCGTEMKVEMGHESALKCEGEKSPDGLKIACAPKPGKGTVFYISGKRSLFGEAGAEPSPSECGEYNFEGLCAVRACYQPYSMPGFAYEVSIINEIDTKYRAALAWEAKTEAGTEKYMKEFEVECVAESSVDPSARKVLWKSTVAFVPSENEVRCNVDCYGLKWYGASNMMFLRKPRTTAIEGCFASVNVSGINNLNLKYNNVFMILPVSEGEYKIEADCGWMEGGSSGGHLLTGSCTERAEGKNVTKRTELKLVNKERPSEDLLSAAFENKKVGEMPEILPGYESMMSVEGPWLPYYKKVEFGMTTLDNEERYDKVMMVSGHFGPDESESHFFVHRIKGTWRARAENENAYRAEIYCVCNLFRAEYAAVCDRENHVTARTRIDIPENRITYGEVKVGRDLFKFNTDTYNHNEAHYAEVSYATSEEAETGDVNHHMKAGYRTWDWLGQEYYYEEGVGEYTNHGECKYCHTFKVKHPKAQIGSVYRNSEEPRRYEESKWLKLHQSLLRYITIRPDVTYFILKHLKNEHISLGYSVKEERPETGPNRVYLSGELFENLLNTTLEYDDEMWEVKCNVEAPVLPMSCNATIRLNTHEEKAVNLDAAIEYGEMICNLEGKVSYEPSDRVKAHFNAAYAMHPGEEYEAECNFDVAERNSEIRMGGEYKSTRKMDGKVNKWKYAGTSEKNGRNRRNFQLNMLCSEDPEETCSTFTVNKGDKWIEYTNKVGEESYDRASITVNENVYKLETKLADELIWDIDTFNLTLDLGREGYGMAVESRICNASVRQNEHGFTANSNFSTEWVEYGMNMIADSENIGYELVYNTARMGGLRVESKMHMAYAFLNFNNAMDAEIFLGTKPGSFGCGIKVPDMECMLDISAEDKIPEERGFKYICSAQVLPDKIVIKNLTVPIMKAEMEVLDTAVGCEVANERCEGFFIKDINVKWRPYCGAEEPTVVKGECVINSNKFAMAIADESRTAFVADVSLAPDTPTKRINFVFTLPFMKTDLMWEYANEANKITMTTKCELCSPDIAEGKMTPFFSLESHHEIEETPEGGNFPVMTMTCEITHTFWIPYLPSKISGSTTTVRSGAVTTLTTECAIDDVKMCNMATEMNGCHKRITFIPAYAFCIPNEIHSDIILDTPLVKCKDNLKIAKSENEWDCEYTAEWTMPYHFRAPKALAAKCKIEVGGCEAGGEICIPSRIAIKNIDAEIPGEVLSAIMPSYIGWIYPLEYEPIRLENSEIIYTRELENDASENKAICVIRGPSLAEPITIGMTLSIAPEHIKCGMMTRDDMVLETDFAWNMETWGCDIKHEMRSPWLDSTLEVTTSSMIVIEKCAMDVKTKGTLAEYVLLDMNLNIGEASWEGKCECKIGQYECLLSRGEEGYEISTKSATETPYIDQNVKITRHGNQYDTVWENSCFKLTLGCTENNGWYEPNVLNHHFKAADCGVKIAYESEGEGRRCILESFGLSGSDFVCRTPPMVPGNKAMMRCEMKEGQHELLSDVPVTMEDFPFMGSGMIRDKILIIRRIVTFSVNAQNRDPASLATFFKEELYCSHEEVCLELAKKIKRAAIAIENSFREAAGKNIYYFNRPAMAGYTLQETLKRLPGRINLGWDWMHIPSLGGNGVKLFHWDLKPYIDYRAEVTYDEKEKLKLDINVESEMFPKLNAGTILTLSDEAGVKIVNLTYIGLGTQQAMIVAIEEGLNIVPLEFGFYLDERKKGFVTICNNTLMANGHHNYTFIMISEGREQYACDVMSPPDSWNEAKIECFEPRRERVIAELSLPEVPSYNEYDYTKLDRVLTEVAKMENKEEREAVLNKLEETATETANAVYKYYEPPRSYKVGLYAVQYITAATMHEAVKSIDTKEPYRIAKKFLTDTYSWEPNFGETYNEISNYVYGLDWASGIAIMAENVLRPFLDAVGYALEGHVALTHETRGDEFVIITNVMSHSYPLYDCKTILNVKRHEWNKLTINATHVNVFARMAADILLEGPEIAIEKVFFGLPEEEAKEFLEIRFIPTESEMYEVQLFFADRAGDRYGCKGGRPSVATPIMHFHCFKIEGDEIPANPPASSMVAYWDVDIEDVPNPSRTGITGALRTIVTLLRSIKACYDEPEVVEEILMKVYHVHDEAVRARLAKTIVWACRRWVDEIAGSEEESPEKENGRGEGWRRWGERPSFRPTERPEEYPEYAKLAKITEQMKTISYEMMVKNLKKEVLEPDEEPMEIMDLGLVADVTSTVYAVCHPIVYYVATVAEFARSSGVVNASRCARCEPGRAKTELMIKMESEAFPILNHEAIAKISPAGLVNTSIETNCAWGWAECELSGLLPAPVKAKFGVAGSSEGVEVVFAPAEEAHMASLYFNTNGRHRCDIEMETLLSASLACHASASGEKGAEEATCDISLFGVCSDIAGLVYDGATRPRIEPRSVARIIENSCEVKNPAFKTEVAAAISSKVEFVAEYCRGEVATAIKSCSELANLTYSYIANAAVDFYNWGLDLAKLTKSVRPGEYYNYMKSALEVALAWCQAWTESIYLGVEGLYESGFALNEIFYNLPSVFARIADGTEIIPKYYHALYSYTGYMIKGAIAPANCVCGMVTTEEGEQAITFNNHVYNFPRKLNHCPYLLAGDVKSSAFTVVRVHDDIVINLPERSVTIDPEMRLFMANKGESKTEIRVPHFSEEFSCVRDAGALTCRCAHMKIVVFAENNRRSAFFIEVAEPICPLTRGLLGEGGNRTEVPEWHLMNGTAASSFEEFIDEYSIERGCKIGAVRERPEIEPTSKCAEIFDSEEMEAACPARRRSFLEACKTGATEPAVACRYAILHNRMCELEGCPVKFFPGCDICNGEESINTELKEAQVVVVVSLNRKIKLQKVDEILGAIRQMANGEGKVYNVSIVTFGGREEMSKPHFHTINGHLEIPPTEEWTLPRLELNGPEPTAEGLIECVEFAYANTRRAAEGAAKIFFLVVPENMDFKPLEENENIKEMAGDFVKTYLYIPKNCERKKGGKGATTIGVRPLFIEEEEICERSPLALANAIAFHELDERITCTCEIVNPYTGEVNDKCRRG